MKMPNKTLRKKGLHQASIGEGFGAKPVKKQAIKFAPVAKPRQTKSKFGAFPKGHVY